eukprot:32110-Eustigmatos_ZCMA.PRE.1
MCEACHVLGVTCPDLVSPGSAAVDPRELCYLYLRHRDRTRETRRHIKRRWSARAYTYHADRAPVIAGILSRGIDADKALRRLCVGVFVNRTELARDPLGYCRNPMVRPNAASLSMYDQATTKLTYI